MAVPELLHVNAWPAVLVLGVVMAAIGLVARRAEESESHRRGARVLEGRQAARAIRRRARSSLKFAGVPVDAAEETRHFKLVGTTGTGKSTAIGELLAQALARGDRAIVTDPEGGYRARFFERRRGDVVLNPFEADSVRWNPFGEIREPWDVEQLASGLVPATEDPSGREWRGYARTFLTAVARRCLEDRRAETAELWRLLTVASGDELRGVVAGSAAQPFLDPENARMFGSIRSVVGSATAALEYVKAQRTRAFSVRDWVRNGRGTHFLPYGAAQIPALRSMLAAWVRLAIFEAMSRTQPGPPLWFVVDELDSLGAIDGLKDALARLRKFGGRCVLGFQSVAQVSSVYGSGDAQTIVENCANSLILRCSASEHGGTSQFASRLIGERQVARTSVSESRRYGERHGSKSVSEHVTFEPAVMAAEIEQLPDLEGLLKLASEPAWRRVRLTPSPQAHRKWSVIAGSSLQQPARVPAAARSTAAAASPVATALDNGMDGP